MDSERQQLLESLFQEAKKKILSNPQDFVWTEDEIGFTVFNTYEGPSRYEPTETECRKMARAILQLKPVGLDLRTKVEPEESDEADVAGEESAEEMASNGTPFLLPIAGMDGYSVDPHGRVFAEKRPGRKAGRLILEKFFSKKGKDQPPRFVCGYRVRVGGKRKRYRPTYFHHGPLLCGTEIPERCRLEVGTPLNEVGTPLVGTPTSQRWDYIILTYTQRHLVPRASGCLRV